MSTIDLEQIEQPRLISKNGNLPPLRLHHFLAWTAAAAALMAYESELYRDESIAAWFKLLTLLPHTLSASLAMTCCGFGLHWRRHGGRFPSQPGHGLLIFVAVGFAVLMIDGLIQYAIWREHVPLDGFTPSSWQLMVLQWSGEAKIASEIGLSVWFAWRTKPMWRWQVFFVLLALYSGSFDVYRILAANVIDLVGNLPWIGPVFVDAVRFFLLQTPMVLPLFSLVVAIVLDLRCHVSRHWSHWAGVAAWMAYVPGMIAYLLEKAAWLQPAVENF